MPGTDVMEIRTALLRGAEEVDARTITVSAGDDLLGGIRAAELIDIPSGDYVIEVVARNLDTSVDKRSLIGLQQDLTITIVLSSACVGVTCPMAGGDPAATECVDGLCVVPDCVGSCMSADTGVDSGIVDAPVVDAATYPCPGVVDYYCCVGVGASTAFARAHHTAPANIVVVRSDGPMAGGLSDTSVVGIGLAAHLDAPLVVTPSDRIHSNLETYLSEISPRLAYIVGGDVAFSPAAEAELRALVPDVVRIGGSGMSSTAADVARFVGNADDRAVIVNGNDANLRRAARASSVAAFARRPLLYVHGGSVPPPETIQVLMDFGITDLDVIGSETDVRPDIIDQIMAATSVTDFARYTNADDYQEAVLVAESLAPAATSAGLVPYSDPLLGVVAGALGQPILYYDDPEIPTITGDYLRTSPIVSVDVMGPFADREPLGTVLCPLVTTP
jgi:hypothetical protein